MEALGLFHKETELAMGKTFNLWMNGFRKVNINLESVVLLRCVAFPRTRQTSPGRDTNIHHNRRILSIAFEKDRRNPRLEYTSGHLVSSVRSVNVRTARVLGIGQGSAHHSNDMIRR